MSSRPKLFSDNNPFPAIILGCFAFYGLITDFIITIIAMLLMMYSLYDALRIVDEPDDDPDKAYYNDGDPIMTDDEYDKMRRDNPTEKVGAVVIGGTTHATPMRSLSNAIDEEELREFINYLSSVVGLAVCIVEPKIDGLALNCTYSGGKLVSAVTRGDGIAGKDVTENVRHILPKTIKYDALEVRGEVYLPKAELKAINAGRIAIKKKAFVSCQSAATATLMHESTAICKARKIKFVAYDVGYGKRDVASNQAALVGVLKGLGFDVLDHAKVRTFDGIMRASKRIFAETEYPSDGSVIKLNDFDAQEGIGETMQCPLYAKAWKG